MFFKSKHAYPVCLTFQGSSVTSSSSVPVSSSSVPLPSSSIPVSSSLDVQLSSSGTTSSSSGSSSGYSYYSSSGEECLECGTGHYSQNTGKNNLLLCANFFPDECCVSEYGYCAPGTCNQHYECTPCEAGTANPYNGSSQCETCEPGYFTSNPGESNVPFPVNIYNSISALLAMWGPMLLGKATPTALNVRQEIIRMLQGRAIARCVQLVLIQTSMVL